MKKLIITLGQSAMDSSIMVVILGQCVVQLFVDLIQRVAFYY